MSQALLGETKMIVLASLLYVVVCLFHRVPDVRQRHSETGQDEAFGDLVTAEHALNPGVAVAEKNGHSPFGRVDDPVFAKPEGEVFLALRHVATFARLRTFGDDFNGECGWPVA